MKKVILDLLIALAALPAVCFGQLPDGSDINQAIPIYFGQTINDTIDIKTRPQQVYSITLAKGQSFSATLKATGGQNLNWSLLLAGPDLKQIGDFRFCNQYLVQGGCQVTSATQSMSYQVAAAGTYYVVLLANSGGISYQLQVTATGTPIAIPPPPIAGCLTGQVDSITYSLQLIAASLPDEASIGGTKLCASCTVKAPAYPQLVSKLETAMGLNVGVSACYDATGNVVQLKMVHP